jgi:uroporphyrinogen-III synthase
MVIVGNLLVTLPRWADQQDPLIVELRQSASNYWVEVFDAPAQLYKPMPETAQSRAVRDLDDWDEAGDTRECVVVCVNRQAAQALEKNRLVIEALKRRRSKLRFAAIGPETAYDFTRMLDKLGVVQVAADRVLTPDVSGHLDDLAARLLGRVKLGTLVIALGIAEDHTDFSQKLISGGLRVVRMPIYTAISQDMIPLPASKAPWYVLVSTFGFMASTIQALAAQRIPASSVTWMGPATSEARARRAYPSMEWISLRGSSPDDFIARDILEKITLTN